MPADLVNATVPTEGERKDLKTVDGGFVIIKPLPYGELLERRDKASRMSMEADTRRGRGSSDTAKVDIDMMQHQTRIYEFSKCIMDHNLDDGTGNKLNFSNPATLNILDPKVGQEIEQLIDDLNQFEEIDEENFQTARTSSIEEAPKLGNTIRETT